MPAAPATASTTLPPLSPVDVEHIEQLREFFLVHRPDNAPKAEELYRKLGPVIWTSLETKYPGTTDIFTLVRHDVFVFM